MGINLALTILFGLLFFGSQVFLWESLKSAGIYASSGIFPSLVYTFTWVHVAHIVMAIILLFWLVPVVKGQNLSIKEENKVLSIGKFWHFLGIIWLIIFFAIFVF